MKKTVAFLMCLSAAGLLAGCGAKTEATTAAADTTGAASTETKAEAKGDPVVINYYDWDIPDQKFIDDFNAANPDIQVVAHSIPANGERLTKLDILAMSGGDMDVMPISDGDQFTRFESGMLAPLDDFIAKDGVDMDKSFGKYAIWGQYDGKYYGIPFRATQSVVYYNKDMFDKAGVEYPKKQHVKWLNGEKIRESTEPIPILMQMSGQPLQHRRASGIQKTVNVTLRIQHGRKHWKHVRC